MDGSSYDGENPKEPIDPTSQYYDASKSAHVMSYKVKTTWKTFITNVNAITSSSTKDDVKLLINTDDLIDALIASAVVCHGDNWSNNMLYGTWDNQHFSPMLYDMDITFGMTWDLTNPGYKAGKAYNYDERNEKGSTNFPWLFKMQTILWDDITARYKELRDCGIISVRNIISLFEDFSREVGDDVYKDDTARWAYPSFGNPPSGQSVF